MGMTLKNSHHRTNIALIGITLLSVLIMLSAITVHAGMKNLTDEKIISKIRNSKGNLLVHFTSYDPNCGPCDKSNPLIDKFSQEYIGKLTVTRIHWEPWASFSKDSKALTKEYKIWGLPTVIFFKDGKEVWRVLGHSPSIVNQIDYELKECCG